MTCIHGTGPSPDLEPVRIRTPVDDPRILLDLRAGQWVVLDGALIAGRDQAHKRLCRLIEEGKELPFDPVGAAVYYMGPSPSPPGRPERPLGAAGPTTAGRMDLLTPPILDMGVKLLIGKGRRSGEVRDSLASNGAVYCAAVGGAGAFYGNLISEARLLAWPELGPEALLALTVKGFPAMVALDLHGRDQYELGPESWRLPRP
ncbi:MAG: fumarate hydratase C-terminal domain-containing protein [Deltaproteobacteria bacterium]|jgi:fumarate hydratase subunit beta|nr:fumarate hydratase C-terminal domain-containing protein [Deltaproteobacteria bacterium]